MWQVMSEQLKQDRQEVEKTILHLRAQMVPIQEAIGKMEEERKRIDDLMAWAEAQRLDTADAGGGKP